MWDDRKQKLFLKCLTTRLSMPNEIIRSIPSLPAETEALLVYGSRARGDSVEGSDLDLLALSTVSRPNIKQGNVSVAVYTQKELHKASGTLFGYHLKRDSICVYDPNHVLSSMVNSFKDVDAARVFSRAKHLGSILTVDGDINAYLPGLYREARYLLRSCLYAKAIDEGDPCFSVRRLASRYGQPRFAELLSAQPKASSSVRDYIFCRQQLTDVLGGLEPNKHGSLEALIVNEWYEDSDLISMALMAIGDISSIGDYAEVKAVFL